MIARAKEVYGGVDHPRLTLILVAGLVVGAVGLGLAELSASLWGPRLLIVGSLLILYAVSGFIAFAVFETLE